MSTFLHRLSRYKQLCGTLTREQIGEKLSVSGRYVGMIERGEKKVADDSPLSTLLDLRIAEASQNILTDQPRPYLTGPRAKLKLLREKAGLTPAQFAKELGYTDASMYVDIEEGRSQMGEKMARKAARLLDVDVEELTNGSDHPPERDGVFGTFGAIPNIEVPKGMKGKYVPLISMAQCGPNVAFDDGNYTGQGFFVINPEDPKAFAVTLAGDSMIPRFEPGDVAIVYPSRPAKNGGVVIARLNDDNGGDVMLKLYQAAADTVTLSSYNPAYPAMSFPRGSFAWIYPIAMVSKVLH